MKSSIRQEKVRYWRRHIAKAAAYAGSQQSYCRAEEISLHSFQYWKKKFADESRQERSVKALLPSPFMAVEVERTEQVLPLTLPDARWVAELIIHLQQGMCR